MLRITPTSQLKQIRGEILESKPINARPWQQIDPSKTVLCLEGEYGLVQESKTTQPAIQYVGTKSTNSCIFVCITSPKDQFFMHCNCFREFDFYSQISRFKNTDKLDCILIGGNSKHPTSPKTLDYILSQLIDVSQRLRVDINVHGQRLLDHNDFSESDRHAFVLDKIIEKSQILHRWLYGEPMNLDDLKFTPDDLKSPFAEFGMAETGFMDMISQVTPFVIKEKLLDFSNVLPTLASDKKTFFTLFRNVINLEGFAYVNLRFEASNFYSNSKLRHFVIDVINKDVIIIPENANTHVESQRRLNMALTTDYRSCYNEGIYLVPSLPPRIVQKCCLMAARKPRALTDAEYADLMPLRVANHRLSLGSHLLNYIQDYLMKSPQLVEGSHELKNSVDNPFYVFSLARDKNDLKLGHTRKPSL